MPVVINEFEVLPETRAAAPREASEARREEGAPGDKIQPCAVATALRSLELQALRVFAH